MSNAKVVQFPSTLERPKAGCSKKIDGTLAAFHHEDGSIRYAINGSFEDDPFLAIQAAAGLGAIANRLWTAETKES